MAGREGRQALMQDILRDGIVRREQRRGQAGQCDEAKQRATDEQRPAAHAATPSSRRTAHPRDQHGARIGNVNGHGTLGRQ